ncbi:hypothetical protein [Streptomyces sp. NPDC048565]|uniref:hypothetical protein n=1 Tax=Streptomyces sp. NPDC048565 TaxID=3155266 RepID=UPI003433EF73
MNEMPPLLTPRTDMPADRTRFRSLLSAFLFAPAALALIMLALTSEHTGRCVTYGEQCGPSLPGWLFA